MDGGGWVEGRELEHFTTTLWLRKCEPSTGGSHFENEKKRRKKEKWPLIHQISSVHHWRICHQTILVFFLFLSYPQSPPIPCTVVECQGLFSMILHRLSLKMSRLPMYVINWRLKNKKE